MKIILSLLIAMLLMILPLPQWWLAIQPQWLALVVIYWVMMPPHKITLPLAWGLGLLIDVLLGAPLGVHALAMMLVAFFARSHSTTLYYMSLSQQMMVVFALSFLYTFVIFITQKLLGIPINSLLFWLSPLASALFWPLIKILQESPGHLPRRSF